MPDLKPLLNAVRQAAALTRRVQALNSAGMMKEGEPVTIADYGSQAILCHAITTLHPDDAVLAEESGEQFQALVSESDRELITSLVAEVLGRPVSQDDLIRWMNGGRDRQAERVWVIDPVDGTKGFIAARRYCIACGVLEQGVPAAGILCCPGYPAGQSTGLLFFAERGVAQMEKLEGGKTYRIAVSAQPNGLSNIRAVESVESDHADHEGMLEVFKAAGFINPKLERIDSQDKYGMVACGDADVYVRLPKGGKAHKVWDHAAGVAIVQAAGGVVTDLDGSLLDFSLGRTLAHNKGMVVTSGGTLHDRLLDALAATGHA